MLIVTRESKRTSWQLWLLQISVLTQLYVRRGDMRSCNFNGARAWHPSEACGEEITYQ